jgi:hypothetical protein
MSGHLPVGERAARARELLAGGIDVWVASASATGEAHLIPLSYTWDGSSVLLSTPERSRTARDLFRAGRGRVALPSTRDVVIVDGVIERVDPHDTTGLVEAFAERHQWDPRLETTPFAFIRLIAEEVQAWSVESELPTRVVFRQGVWADDPAE